MSSRTAIFNLEFDLKGIPQIKVAVDELDKIQKELDEAKKGSLEYVEAQKKLEASQKRLNSEFKASEKSVTSFSSTLKSAASSLGAFLAIGSGVQLLRGAVNTIIDFEQALANLSAITGATGGDLDFYAEQAAEIGRTTTLSASQAVGAFQLIASASPQLLENSAALASVTKEAVVLAEAAGITLPEAAAALGNSLNSLRLPAEDAGRIINVLAAGATFGAREIPFVSQALEKFGATAQAAGVEIEESVAAIELLGKSSSDAGGVGTNLRNVITILRQEAAKSGREFKGLTGELDLYADKLDDVNFLVKTFGRENLNAAQQLIVGRGELSALTEQLTGTNEAYRQAEVRTSTLSAEIKGLASAYEGIILSARESTGALSATIRFLRENLTTILRTVAVVAAGFVGYRVAIAATNASLVIGRAATTAYTIAKTLFTQGLRAATLQAQAFNNALRANPIGLVAGLLATATAAFFAFRKSAEQATDAQKNFNDAVAAQNALISRTQSLERRVRLVPELSSADLSSLESELQSQIRQLSDQKVEIEATITGSRQDFQKQIDALQKEIDTIDLSRFDRFGNVQILSEETIKANLQRSGDLRKEIARLQKQIEDTERKAFRQFGTTAEQTAEQLKILEPGLEAVRKRLSELEKQGTAPEFLPGTIKALEERVKALRKTIVEDLRIDSAQFAPTVNAYKAAVKELQEATKLLQDEDPSIVEGSINALQKQVSDLREVINNTSGEAENFGLLVEQLIEAQVRLSNLQARLSPVDRDAIRKQEIAEEERHALALLQIRENTEEQQLQLRLAYARQRLEGLKQENEAERLEFQKQFNQIVELEEELSEQRRRIAEQAAQDARQRQLEELQGISLVLTESIAGLGRILQSQQQTNQLLIGLQQQRVNDAVKIADQGNAKLLKAEQERLDELTRRREQFVRAQQALAAAQLIAESSLAIARAAAEGGAAAPFTIAATLLALTAGLVQARATAQAAAAGFKKGGYTGDVGVNEEAGVVHGKEFVIDAATTAQLGLRGKSMGDFKDMFVGRKPLPREYFAPNGGQPLSQKQVAQIVDAIKSQPVPMFTFDEKGIFTAAERTRRSIDKVKRYTR
jgi:TP901 family phage tail tape measure protein